MGTSIMYMYTLQIQCLVILTEAKVYFKADAWARGYNILAAPDTATGLASQI